MPGLGFTNPTFTDVPNCRIRKGSLPSRAVLISPHENEHPASLPFQAALFRKLLSEGMQVEERKIDGNMRRGWALREKIAKNDLERKVHSIALLNKCTNLVLNLEDQLIRAREISSSLSGDSQTFVLEVHAMNCTGENGHFSETHLKRLAGTGFTVGNFFSDLLSLRQMLGEKELWGAISDLARMQGFSFAEAKKELAALIKELRPNKQAILEIEVPSLPVYLPEAHQMEKIYFSRRSFGSVAMKLVSTYEEYYCTVTREGIGFTEKDLSAASSLIVIPKPAKSSYQYAASPSSKLP